MTRVTSLDQLKEMIANGVHDYFIELNGGLCSSKFLDYSPKSGKYYILNEIDGTKQRLNEKHFMNRDYTNVGYAMTVGALFAYEEYPQNDEPEEKVLDRNGKEITIGCKVRWYDPEKKYRDLKRIYEVYDFYEDIVYFSDDYSEVEAPPSEVEIVD